MLPRSGRADRRCRRPPAGLSWWAHHHRAPARRPRRRGVAGLAGR